MRKKFDAPSMDISIFDDEVHTQQISGYTAGQHVEGQMFENDANKRMVVYTVRLRNVLEFNE